MQRLRPLFLIREDTKLGVGCIAYATTNRDHGKLVDAIIAGIPADQVKDKIQAVSERQKTLEVELSRAPASDPIRIHPKMAVTYQERVSELISRAE